MFNLNKRIEEAFRKLIKEEKKLLNDEYQTAYRSLEKEGFNNLELIYPRLVGFRFTNSHLEISDTVGLFVKDEGIFLNSLSPLYYGTISKVLVKYLKSDRKCDLYSLPMANEKNIINIFEKESFYNKLKNILSSSLFYLSLMEILKRKDFSCLIPIYVHEIFHFIYNNINLNEKNENNKNLFSVLENFKNETIAFSSSFYKNKYFDKEFLKIKECFYNIVSFWDNIDFYLKHFSFLEKEFPIINFWKDFYTLSNYLGYKIGYKLSWILSIKNFSDLLFLYFYSSKIVGRFVNTYILTIPEDYLTKENFNLYEIKTIFTSFRKILQDFEKTLN